MRTLCLKKEWSGTIRLSLKVEGSMFTLLQNSVVWEADYKNLLDSTSINTVDLTGVYDREGKQLFIQNSWNI